MSKSNQKSAIVRHRLKLPGGFKFRQQEEIQFALKRWKVLVVWARRSENWQWEVELNECKAWLIARRKMTAHDRTCDNCPNLTRRSRCRRCKTLQRLIERIDSEIKVLDGQLKNRFRIIAKIKELEARRAVALRCLTNPKRIE